MRFTVTIPLALFVLILFNNQGDAAQALAADLSKPGPYLAGWREVDVPRRTGGTFKAVLYYPASTPGSGGTYDPNGAPYPAISFGHGFLTPVEQYASTLQHLATWGYFVIATRSQGGLFPDHAEYGRDLSDCLTYLEVQNANGSSWLYQQVSTGRFAMSGHSMGGGASILATAADPRVRVLANLAAAETNPSAIAQMPNIRVPVSLISGSADSITPLAQHGLRMYNNGLAPRQLPVIDGGFHCGFIDQSIFGCDSGGISRSEQLAITRRLLTGTFNLYLYGDQAVWRGVWGPEFDEDVALDPNLTKSDPGVRLEPPNALAKGAVGQSVPLLLRLTNTGPVRTSYRLFVEGNQWPTNVSPTQTPVLEPNQSVPITVNVQIGAGGPDTDAAVVSARSDADGGTRGYVQTAARRFLLGDLNCDGAVNFGDVSPFVVALAGEPGYEAQYPNCAWRLADCNGDQRVDFADISPFVGLLGR